MGYLIDTIRSLTNEIKNVAEDSAARKAQLVRLKRLYLLECRTNLKILDIAKKESMDKADVLKLLKHLNNESSYVLYCYADRSLLRSLFSKVNKLNDNDPVKNDALLISIISKIDLLKILASNFEHLEQRSVIRIKARINNLYKQLKEVVTSFNNEINDINK